MSKDDRIPLVKALSALEAGQEQVSSLLQQHEEEILQTGLVDASVVTLKHLQAIDLMSQLLGDSIALLRQISASAPPETSLNTDALLNCLQLEFYADRLQPKGQDPRSQSKNEVEVFDGYVSPGTV